MVSFLDSKTGKCLAEMQTLAQFLAADNYSRKPFLYNNLHANTQLSLEHVLPFCNPPSFGFLPQMLSEMSPLVDKQLRCRGLLTHVFLQEQKKQRSPALSCERTFSFLLFSDVTQTSSRSRAFVAASSSTAI